VSGQLSIYCTGKGCLFLGCAWHERLCSVIIMCMCQANSHACKWFAFPYPHQTCLTLGAIIRLPPICQMTNYQKIIVLYSGKYCNREISYSRILPDELLVAQMIQEILWCFCNLISYYKPETRWFMKGETSDNESWKTQRL